MKYRFLLGAVVGISAALGWTHAQAQLSGGTFYLGGEGGWTALENAKATGGKGGGAGATIKFSDGFNVGARAGMMWGPWRVEEEFRYQSNDLTSIAGIKVSGSAKAYAFMTNVLYDFNLGSPFSPHLGGGIGAVDLTSDASVPGFGRIIGNSDDWEFGYQAIAGIRYNINPSLALDLDYRYLGTADASFKTTAALGGGTVKSSYNSHNLVASLSWIFGAPPPPPVAEPVAMPAPPPPPNRQVFLVFFDWDRDTITPAGGQIIAQAAAAFRAGHQVRIQVTGYTDRSGSPGYNQRLSERRANNVANALARNGVPRNQMAVSGRGENDNRVPTADGVREPQNRRVEIVVP